MTKNNFLILSFILITFQMVSFGKEKPANILFIAVDDLKPTLACYGDKNVLTPNIDKLAASGVLFQNAYCQQAVCAPSRISLFTGLRPDATQVWDLKTNMRNKRPQVVTLPQYLAKNGYETFGLGKLMHGAVKNDPKSWTIPYEEDDELEYAKGYVYPANGKYQNKEIHKAVKMAKKKKLGWRETNQFLKAENLAPSTECMDIPDDAYEDGAVAQKAMKYLDDFKNKNSPFFLALGFHKPHLPFAAPKKYWDLYEREQIPLAEHRDLAEGAPKYAYHTWGELRNYSDIVQNGPVPEDKQKELIHGYWASVSYVDAQIGLVMQKLKKLGLDKNTIIVLWGDHGWHLGDHGIWCKHSNFEQATKAPLIISAPNVKSGTTSQSMAELVDVYPTIVDLAGLSIPEILEGQSLKTAAQKPDAIHKTYAISQYPRGTNVMGYSIRTHRYRLTLWLKGEFQKGEIVSNPEIDGIELYDYELDPLETKSFAECHAYKDVTEELKLTLLNLLQEQNEKRNH